MTLRYGVALVLLGVSAGWTALAWAPTLSWTQWLVHLGASETTLIATVLAILAFVLLVPELRDLAPGAVALAGASVGLALAGLVPFARYAPLYREQGASFSLVQYVTGRAPGAAVPRLDVDLGGILADVYPGRGDGPRPAVVVVHGGSWRYGDKGEMPHVSRALADAGITVFDVRYRLADQHPFPAAVADVRCALGLAASRAAEFGIDPARISLLGRSAGGQIALYAAYADDVPPACDVRVPPVHRVAAIYPAVNMRTGYDDPILPDVVEAKPSVAVYLQGGTAERGDAYDRANPTSHLDHPVPPTLLVHGLGERCVRPSNSADLAEALRAKGHAVQLMLLPLADHGFDVRPGGLGEQLARQALVRFFAD